MKRFFENVAMFWGALWILLTDKEEARQYEYDNGGGEID